MIKSKDRSRWFGASDTHFIMSNFDTATFKKWWFVKLGIFKTNFSTKAMFIGSEKEHQIIDFIGSEIKKDKQKKKRRLRLRVNYDGTTRNRIIEVKTTAVENVEKAIKNKQYMQQVQVQMFGLRRKTAEIWVYGLISEEYDNLFLPIDGARLYRTVVARDNKFLCEYLKRLKYLGRCLKMRRMPTTEEFRRIYE